MPGHPMHPEYQRNAITNGSASGRPDLASRAGRRLPENFIHASQSQPKELTRSKSGRKDQRTGPSRDAGEHLEDFERLAGSPECNRPEGSKD